jgi:hypothetical protein
LACQGHAGAGDQGDRKVKGSRHPTIVSNGIRDVASIMRRVKRNLAASGLAIVLILLGCVPAQRAGGPEGPDAPGTTLSTWPFAPVAVRVHPLSRVVERDGRLEAEVLVTCSDADGESTRAVGSLWARVEAGDASEAVQSDLSSMDVNRACWDPIMRGYRLRVPLPEGLGCANGGSVQVQVRLRLPDDVMLQASGPVACP